MTSATRRRGAALEAALLEAAWAELLEKGYASFTIEGVAERAHTGRQVLYRRWASKWDLVVAAVGHHENLNPVRAPDTGSLRGDLIAYLVDASAKRAELAAMFMLNLAQTYGEGGSAPTPMLLRDEIMRGRASLADVIFDRAVARGEVEAGRLTPRVRTLPFDLLRGQLLLTLAPVPDSEIVAIVDEIVLPLLQR